MAALDAERAAPAAAEPLSKSYVSYALWMLLIIYTLNFLDRQIMSILAEPIKKDLGLQDWQLGLMTGLAFAVVYTLLGIPIARHADKFSSNRVGIISVALAVWSGFTVLCGAAQNFVQILLARIGVGVGEAGCTPPAHALIADTVPPEKRASAIAFYSMGVPIGTFLGFAFGGLIAQYLGWRWAFVLVGLPGVLLALIAWTTLKEPRKLGLVKAPAADAPATSFGQALKELGAIKTYWLVCFAAAVLAFLGYGQAAFFGSFFIRVHEMPIGQIGLWLGVVIGISGAVGTWLGGVLADSAAKRDVRAYYSIPAVAMVLGTPFFIGAMLAPTSLMALGLLVIPTLLGSLWYGPVYASIQAMVPTRLRATAVAIMLFIVNMVGLGLGPTVLGFVSSYLAVGQGMGEAEGLRWALIWLSLTGIITVILFWMARYSIKEDLERAKAAA